LPVLQRDEIWEAALAKVEKYMQSRILASRTGEFTLMT